MTNLKQQLIKGFNDFDLKALKTNERIYLLKVLFSYYEAILSAYYGKGLVFLSSGIDDLNDYFKVLRKKMIELVESDETFSEIKNGNAYAQVVEQITSLYSSAEFLDVIWDESMVPSIINLREEIADKDLFENQSEIHKVSVIFSAFLDAIPPELEIMQGYLDKRKKHINEVELPKYKEQFEGMFDKKMECYVTKEADDFRYKGKLIPLSKKADYYQVFCALYALLPNGGEIEYKDLITEVKRRLPKTKSKSEEEMRKHIQSNLTDKTNGFLRYAKLPPTEDNSRPLIEVIKGFGIRFNNKAG